jgi:hypothetical protein
MKPSDRQYVRRRVYGCVYLVRALAIAIFILTLTGLSRAADAQPIFSDFETGDTYTQTAYGIGSGLGGMFTAARTAVVGRVELALAAQPGTVASVTVSIYTTLNLGATPIWTATNASVSAPGLYSFMNLAAAPVILPANQAFFVMATINGAGGVNWYSANPTGFPNMHLVQQCVGGTFCFWTADTSGPVYPPLAARVSDDVGACCSSITGGCIALTRADCTAIGLSYVSPGAACAPGLCHACPSDFNRSGTVTVQDIFDFLSAWFAGCP